MDESMTGQGVRYDVRYRERGGRLRVKTWRRKADAVRLARSVEVDKDRGFSVDPALARTPVREVAAAWLESNPGKRGAAVSAPQAAPECRLSWSRVGEI